MCACVCVRACVCVCLCVRVCVCVEPRLLPYLAVHPGHPELTEMHEQEQEVLMQWLRGSRRGEQLGEQEGESVSELLEGGDVGQSV